jgi:hypothetical protein
MKYLHLLASIFIVCVAFVWYTQAVTLIIPPSSGGTATYTPDRSAYDAVIIETGALSNVQTFDPTLSNNQTFSLTILSWALANATNFSIFGAKDNSTTFYLTLDIRDNTLNQLETFFYNVYYWTISGSIGNNSLNRVNHFTFACSDCSDFSMHIWSNSLNYTGLNYIYVDGTIASNGVVSIWDNSFGYLQVANTFWWPFSSNFSIGSGSFNSLVTGQFYGNLTVWDNSLKKLTKFNPYNVQGVFSLVSLWAWSLPEDFVLAQSTDLFSADFSLTYGLLNRLFYYQDYFSAPLTGLVAGDVLSFVRKYQNFTNSPISEVPINQFGNRTGPWVAANQTGTFGLYMKIFKPSEFNTLYGN